MANNNARKDGRYNVWSKIDVNGQMVDSLVKFLVKKKTFVDPTLGAFEYRKEEGGQDGDVKLNGYNNMKAVTRLLRKGVAYNRFES